MATFFVKKIVVNKRGMNTNLGEISIDELTGHVNIGTTYEGDFSKIIEEKIKQKLGKEAVKD